MESLTAGGASEPDGHAPARDGVPAQPATVDALEAGMTGRWEVHTRASRHIWDLDAKTYTRLPGQDSGPMPYDGQPMVLTRVEVWPVVGAQSLVFFDDPVDEWLEHWRICSRIRRIVALPPDAGGPSREGLGQQPRGRAGMVWHDGPS